MSKEAYTGTLLPAAAAYRVGLYAEGDAAAACELEDAMVHSEAVVVAAAATVEYVRAVLAFSQASQRVLLRPFVPQQALSCALPAMPVIRISSHV
jgi:hypothetical protein